MKKREKDRNSNSYVSLLSRQFRTVTFEIYGPISIPFRAAVCLLIGNQNMCAG